LKQKIRIPAEKETNILRYSIARFAIAFFLINYGLAVCAWAGLFSAMGTRLADNILSAILISAVAAGVVSLSARPIKVADATIWHK
jgi:hypothetical protein